MKLRWLRLQGVIKRISKFVVCSRIGFLRFTNRVACCNMKHPTKAMKFPLKAPKPRLKLQSVSNAPPFPRTWHQNTPLVVALIQLKYPLDDNEQQIFSTKHRAKKRSSSKEKASKYLRHARANTKDDLCVFATLRAQKIQQIFIMYR